MKYHYIKNKGFTLVETLVAISIIMVAIIGPFVTIETDLIASYTSRDELIANSLAQEGIEYVHYMRDTQYLAARYSGSTYSFASNFSQCYSNTCTIDPNAGSISAAIKTCDGTCTPLYITPTGLYTKVAGTNIQSRFTRSFQFCYMNTGGACNNTVSNEIRATVTVTWSTENHPHTTTVTDYLQNWLL